MTKYMYASIDTFEDPQQCFDTLAQAKAKAAELTAKYSDTNNGFVVLEVSEIGRYEKVSPVWSAAPTETKEPPAGDAKPQHIVNRVL